MQNTPTLLAVRDVVLKQQSRVILEQVNFSVQQGEFVYLIGKTGSGKTTLLRALYADHPLSQGSIVLCGYNLAQIIDKEVPYLRRKLGIVFQQPQLLWDRTVWQNLLFVLKATDWKNSLQIEQALHQVLNLVGLWEKRDQMPHCLSGGEQQKLGIARALLNQPSLIIADEPTGSLDPQTAKQIMQLLYDLPKKQNCAVILATHQHNFIEEFTGRLLICEDKKIRVG